MRPFYIFFYIFLLFFKPEISFSQNLAYIDINYIIKNSILGKKTIQELDSTNKKNLEILKKQQSTLNEERITIENKKNIISDDKFKNEVMLLNKKIDDFKILQDQMSSDFKLLNKQKFDEIIKKINFLIEEYMVQNNITIILNKESVYVTSSNNDITNEILKIVDKNLK